MLTLFTDTKNRYFFLIPDGADIPDGAMPIRSLPLGGKERHVDPLALQEYEITSEQAETFLQDQMRESLDQAAETLKGWVANWLMPKPTPTASSEPHPRRALTLDLIATLMDQPVDALRTDPEARQAGWMRLFYDTAIIFQGAKSGDPQELDDARYTMREICAILRDHGVPVDPRFDHLPDALRDLYHRAERE